MKLVVVESPAKAKTINKYLGSDFIVLASYGHVRDLPSKDGSVRPDDDFDMIYETDPKSAKHLSEIAKALKGADHLYLATDPDREGEAISWHVLEALGKKQDMGRIHVKRVVFNEITKTAVLDAIAHPRDLDMNLINAQQARRALDYLVGFTLSPVLWRKLPGTRSAGRVQSVALRLVCERELEIEAFRAQEYWSVEAVFTIESGESFTARLTHLDGQKLDRFDLSDEAAATRAVAAIESADFRVRQVETKPTRRNPYAPFTTSTLQQEASRKLGFGARRTMDIAQRLYEGIDIGGETVGLITYMRTDGVQMANEAIAACRDVIRDRFGAAFVPGSPRIYRAKAKNAQEAHEAIRPTDLARLPDQVASRLDRDQLRLYDLIWKRAVASQMESAVLQRTTIDVACQADRTVLRATGTVVQFPGFLKLYEEGRDDSAQGDGDDKRLPAVRTDSKIQRGTITPSQHFTEPPPRYTEATLVKKLEELGIGRPSTYASILSVLQDRSYVRLDRNRFFPEDKGLLVTAFLTSYFRRYVEYGFTADLEAQLDDISAGRTDWKEVLRLFWRDFHAAVDETTELRVRDVLDAVNELMAPHLYPNDGADRACPACSEGLLNLKGGKYGFFVGCTNYPNCRYTRAVIGADGDDGVILDGPKVLGLDPGSGLEVSLRKGPYGLYFQLGEAEEKKKPKRVSLPKDVPPDDVTLELALKLLALPREVGPHPETAKPIVAGIGRYGPFLETDGTYAKLAGTEEVLSIGLNHAVTLIAESGKKGKGRASAKVLRELGEHPEEGGPINVMDGRYGPYVKHGKINATLPKGRDPAEITLDDAITLIRERAAKGKGGSKRKAPAKKKPAAKKSTAKAKTKKPATKAKKTTKAKRGKAASSEAAVEGAATE